MIFSSRFSSQCSTYQLSLTIQMRLRMYYRTILVIILSTFLLYLFWPGKDSIAWRLPYFGVSRKSHVECYDISDNYMLLKSLDAARDSNSGHECYQTLLHDACLLGKSMLFTPLDDDDDSNECDILSSDGLKKPTLQDFTIGFVIWITNDEYHQVERLLINIYRRNHLYMFYVCEACSFTYERLQKYIRPKFRNIHVERIRKGQTVFDAWRSIINFHFDCTINLDQYDFPLMSIDKLEYFLYTNYGVNIIDGKQRSVNDALIHSVCSNNRQYKIGYGILPESFKSISSGKFALTKTFVNYLMKNTTLVQHSSSNSRHMQFPEQYFIVNVLENSKCSPKMSANLFLDSSQVGKWNFDQSDFHFIYGQMSSHNPPYFVRKVDPRYNQQIINDVESTVNPFFNELHLGFISVNTTLRDYWSPISMTNLNRYFSGFLKRMLHRWINSRCGGTKNQSLNSLQFLQGHMLNKYDLVEGMNLKFIVSCADVPVTLEALISKNWTTISNQVTNDRAPLSSSEEKSTLAVETVSNPLISATIIISDNADPSYFFRNAMSLFYDTDQLAIDTKWEIRTENLLIDIIAIDPQGKMSLPFPFEIGFANQTILIPLPLSKSRKQRVPTGPWQLQIFHVENLLAELNFHILPAKNSFENSTFVHQTELKDSTMWLDVLSKFYFIRDVCVSSRHVTNYRRYCKCENLRLPVCEFGTSWSSSQKDLKSDAIEMLL